MLDSLTQIVGSPAVQVGSLVVCLVCLAINVCVTFDLDSFSMFERRRGTNGRSRDVGTVYIHVLPGEDARTGSAATSDDASVSQVSDEQVRPGLRHEYRKNREPVSASGSVAPSIGGR